MAKVLLLTNTLGASAEVLPALGLLQHQVKILPAEASVLVDAPDVDLVLIDARRDLPAVKSLTKLLHSTGVGCPISTILTDSDILTTKQLRDQTYTALKDFQIPKHPTCVKLVLSNSARRFTEACWAFNQRLVNPRPPNGNTTSASG
jgi:hypothetical protein